MKAIEDRAASDLVATAQSIGDRAAEGFWTTLIPRPLAVAEGSTLDADRGSDFGAD